MKYYNFWYFLSTLALVFLPSIEGQAQEFCAPTDDPTFISQTVTSNFTDLNGFALRIIPFHNPDLVLVATSPAGLRAVNVSNPLSLSLASLFLDGSDVRHGICFQDDNTCLVAGQGINPGIRFIEMFPDGPSNGTTQSASEPFATLTLSDPEVIVLSQNEQWAYVADSGLGHVVLDLRNISTPSVVMPPIFVAEATNIFLKENSNPPYTVLTRGIQFNGGITLFDVTDPL